MPVRTRLANPAEASPADRAALSVALDVYAPLLSPRRAEAMRMHFEEDLSYAEIAAQMRISRQSVHEHVAEGIKTIRRYESRLGVVDRTTSARRELVNLALKLRSTKLASGSLARIANSIERIAEGL
jgi:predicted DNA-binding protein YlxM (UPF0122 family)